MIKTILKAALKIVGALLIVSLLIWALSCTNFGMVSELAREVRNTVVNFFVPDQEQFEQDTKAQAQRIAEEFGWDVKDVEGFIQKYQIEGLEVMDLPEDAVVKKTVTKTLFGTEVTVTLYRDPGYLTLQVEDHVATVSVPDKAQKYISVWGLS